MSDEKPEPAAEPVNIAKVWLSVDESLPRLVIAMPLDAWYQGKPIPRISPLAAGQVPNIVLTLHAVLSNLLKGIAALLLMASTANAGAKDVLLPALYYSALNYADYRTSTDAIREGRGQELNGSVRTMGLVPVKIGSTALATAVDVLLQGGKHKSTVWIYRATVGVILGGVSLHNANVNRGAK